MVIVQNMTISCRRKKISAALWSDPFTRKYRQLVIQAAQQTWVTISENVSNTRSVFCLCLSEEYSLPDCLRCDRIVFFFLLVQYSPFPFNNSLYNAIFTTFYIAATLLVTCVMCASVLSVCFWFPVRSSPRSSLCVEYGRWWGHTAGSRVWQETPLSGRSDRWHWSLVLQERESQTLSQKWGSKPFQCSFPCCSCSCGLNAFFIWSV